MDRFIKVSALFGVDEKDGLVCTVRPTMELNVDKIGDKTLDEVYEMLKTSMCKSEMFHDGVIRDATSEELMEDKEDA